ncbi:MAG: hypothetical protein ACYDDA_04760 [Acidiferrobacteraceae bacterium]
MKWWYGLLALAGGASIGALAGAAFTPGGGDRKHAAAMGAAGGLTLTGIAALGATISPDTRAAGLTAVLPVAGLVVLGAVSGAHQQLT